MKYLLCSLLLLVFPATATWYPVKVRADGEEQLYKPLVRANKAWRLCALLPHGKDHYWWGVAWGLAEEADRLGVEIGIYDAGGYTEAERQLRQLDECEVRGAQGYILAAVSAELFNAELPRLRAKGAKVVDLVNGINSNQVDSRSLVSFVDMTQAAVQYLFAASGRQDFSLAWFPGPSGAAWVMDAELGLKQGLSGSQVELIEGGYGVTETFVQADLVRALTRRFQADYLLGNAVAATVAARMFPGRVLAFYSNPQTMALVEQGKLMATVTDSPVLQARISVDLAVRLLQGEKVPGRVSPEIRVVTPQNISELDMSQTLPPEGQWMTYRELSKLEGAKPDP